MLGKKAHEPLPLPKHENEKLFYLFPIKSNLEIPTARHLCIGVDTTVKYITNKISDFLSLFSSFHNILAFFSSKNASAIEK